MAKKKISTEPPKYYVYYDKKNGEILSVTNEKSDRYEYGLVTTFAEVEKFLSGDWAFRDYKVGYRKDTDKRSLAILSNEFSGYVFRNSMFEWITEQDYEAECIVQWNNPDKAWKFSLDDNFKKTYNNNILASKVVFFVTLETDFDFLIRTITLDVEQLLDSKRIIVPFDSAVENKIEKISISSKLVFKSYKLEIINE
jgi:hypothetical protein